MLDHQVILRADTLARLLRRAGTEPHQTVQKGATWYDPDTLRRLDAEMHAELARDGLANDHGLHPHLHATVEAIAHPDLEYYGWMTGVHEGRPLKLAVLAGSGRGEAFTLVHNEDAGVIVLVSVPAHELLESFLTQVPHWAPAASRAISVPKSKIDGSRREGTNEELTVLRSDSPSAAQKDVSEFKRILSAERSGGGQLYVAARGRSGQRNRSAKPVTYIDNTEGRWLLEEQPGTGEPMLVATPATTAVLTSKLREAQSGVAG
ncbi:hypothetical protein BJF85_06140 [Saccharomonospora sp. CUA-673]|uniref:ESX secretion-associated protein EspG n=1 Tax=Saccharomonospora sp. CUA-673 TaxID=1904969 RepID=UPI00095C19B5|nr:ESX secretion-associated protein EspG [Saccharomonospora sp. CUA-673]OLT40696.1 hypothetical protein BJF85_06140 [Saccharomonospora sp. CUA-673]